MSSDRVKVIGEGEWFSTETGRRQWRIDSDGVWVRGLGSQPKPLRKLRRAHPTEQALPAFVWSEYEVLIRDAAHATDVDKRTIVACLCAESAGRYNAERHEPSHGDYSLGLMQTLTLTARHVGGLLGFPTQVPLGDLLAAAYRMPKNSIPNGGELLDWRRFLFEPRNSILLGAATLAALDKRYGLNGDPVLLAASYNAGGPYVDNFNPWGLRMYGPHVDTFAGFWTIAAEVVVA